ncbi:IQ domain-containing protein [Seminavis robusta]|uniref:IQ domain-containing protein n=1 Tax=Seminavis robusta TaxID=568900 RepID=A0A9N8DYJ9_9STRA|nr:IQ domain-containing protein [Seminavis robusta]|eukprot:Sro478_g150960.1 IQ domain-containing protein (723) ;mRNA; r:11312-13480
MSTTSSIEDVTMDEVARIMREEDAQFLESIHLDRHNHLHGEDTDEDDDDDGVILVGEDGEKLVMTEEMDLSSASSSKKKGRLFRSYSSGYHSDGTGGGVVVASSLPEENEPDVIYRQCLSGEIKSYRSASPHHHNGGKLPIAETDETTTTTTIEVTDCEETTPSRPTCVATNAEQLVMAANSPSVKRSISSNRRINEAVQFAEAVGEMPPLVDSNELCIIEEDNDDDDTDEDEDGDGTVVHHDPNDMTMVDDTTTTQTPQSQQQQLNNTGRPPDSDDGFSDPMAAIAIAAAAAAGEGGGGSSRDSLPPVALTRRKSRPKWPFQLPGWTFSRLDTSMHKILEITAEDYVYKGIRSNPPEIVKRGISRGNHVQLHRKAWLEVSDKYHRYGKNLRLYYRHWESLGYPTNMFFDWLDSKGEAAGQPLPELEECPRSKLDSDSVLYIANPEVTQGYALSIVTDGVSGRARFVDVDGEMVQTGPEGWIFVLRDGVIYGAAKVTSISGHSKKRFHHSSFFGGKAVAAAGIIITDEEGFLVRLYPHSGHYRPREAHMQRLLYFLYHQGVDLRTFEMDIQQIMHVARDKADSKQKKPKKPLQQDDNNNGKHINGEPRTSIKPEGEKKKKIDSLQLMPAVSVACYVAHKAHFIGEGVFAQIHQLKTANVASVSEALQLLNRKRRVSVTSSTKDQTLFNGETKPLSIERTDSACERTGSACSRSSKTFTEATS